MPSLFGDKQGEGVANSDRKPAITSNGKVLQYILNKDDNFPHK